MTGVADNIQLSLRLLGLYVSDKHKLILADNGQK